MQVTHIEITLKIHLFEYEYGTNKLIHLIRNILHTCTHHIMRIAVGAELFLFVAK